MADDQHRKTPTSIQPRDPIDPGQRGALTIADRVVEKIAIGAAREVSPSTGDSSWSTSLLAKVPGAAPQLPHASATVAGGRARIGLDVAAPWATPASELAAQVRDHVQQRVATLTGITIDAVDVTIEQLVRAATPRRRVL